MCFYSSLKAGDQYHKTHHKIFAGYVFLSLFTTGIFVSFLLFPHYKFLWYMGAVIYLCGNIVLRIIWKNRHWNIAKTLDVYFPKGTFTNWEKRLVFLMDWEKAFVLKTSHYHNLTPHRLYIAGAGLFSPLKLMDVSGLLYEKLSGRPRSAKPLAASSVTTTLFWPLEQWQTSSPGRSSEKSASTASSKKFFQFCQNVCCTFADWLSY